MPAVAVTESWKPTDHTSQGSKTSRPSTAAERIEAVVRGLPASTAASAMHAITPARSTDGSAPVRIVKNATAPKPIANFGHRESRSKAAAARTGASTIATFPPETTKRWLRPAARKSRSSPGSSPESSPRSKPRSSPASFEGNTRSMDRPTTFRAPCVARTKALGEGPTHVNVCSWSWAGIPLCRRASANLSSLGTRSTPSSRTRSPRRTRGMSSLPLTHTDERRVAAPSGHSTRRTCAVADQPKVVSRGSVLSVPSMTTRSGTRVARSAPSRPRWWKPLHPVPIASTPRAERTAATTGGTAEATRSPATASTVACSGGRRWARASGPGP